MINDILIVSDPHVGFTRTSGVTRESLQAYRELQFKELRRVLLGHAGPKIILGDLFDSCMVENSVWLQTLELLAETSGDLLIVAGNHDLSRRADQMPSLRLLAEVLPAIREDEVVFAFEPMTWHDSHIVPHMPTQALFDEALAAVPDNATVLTHACFNNPFVAEKDHSLNFTTEQARRFKRVISGHEHNTSASGNVCMMGSLLPCSIDEAPVDKFSVLLSEAGELEQAVKTYDATKAYAEIDWKDLDTVLANSVRFIRVVGTAEPEQGASVIQQVNKFRRNAGEGVYFVTNSVKVGGIELQALEDATQSVDTFDAEKVFWEVLDPKFTDRIRAVVNAEGALV